jgi:hypothetical protein
MDREQLIDELKHVSNILTVSRHMSFIGQRADKINVSDVGPVKDVAIETDDDLIIRNGAVKEVERYTISCDDCGGDGYYDQLGEIICDDCGMVISGDSQPMIRTEYSEGSDKQIGQGRGLEKMNKEIVPYGTHEPAQH